ncbi:MAG TPA: glycosyltransferase [Flavisolibacter sp.]|nr:glycosyltransferase [Flavisolibacter sp.]
MATKLLEIELSEGLTDLTIDDQYESYRLLIRSEKQPIGWINLNSKGKEKITPSHIESAIIEQLSPAITHEALLKSTHTHNLSQVSQQAISIVVCTRDRTHQLISCLTSLLELDYVNYEILIIDNAPSNDETLELCSRYPVKYIKEMRPGLDWARNRGIQEASNEIIAFTDDDVKVDKYWLQAINNIFSNKEVMGASGYVTPAEMETPAQELFEYGYGGMGHGLRRRFIHKEKISRQELFWASSFGIGANMAFRKDVFSRCGMFHTGLDVGTPSHGGGDIEMFHRIVAKGLLFLYDPKMMVWHFHRRTEAQLKKQVYDNGRSFGCYLIHCLNNSSIPAHNIFYFFFKEWLYKWNVKNIVSAAKIPRSYTWQELKGMLSSPLAYYRTMKWDKEVKANPT